MTDWMVSLLVRVEFSGGRKSCVSSSSEELESKEKRRFVALRFVVFVSLVVERRAVRLKASNLAAEVGSILRYELECGGDTVEIIIWKRG
jgi:hypothetical protein